MRKPAAAALPALLLLAACSSGIQDDPKDPYSGLSREIVPWTEAVEASHPTCKAKVGGKGCVGFEVTCKGARDLTPEDRARGVTAKVVAALRFSAKTEDGSTGKPGSAFAEFSKANGEWTRIEAMPVNPSSCSAL